MDGGGGQKPGKLGNLRATKPVPNFLKQFHQPEEGGIEEALRKHQERGDPEDRPEEEDDGPLVVEALEALPSKQRARAMGKNGGSLSFKGDNSAAARFVDSAFKRVAEHDLPAAEAPKEAEDEAGEGVTGSHVFAAARSRSKAEKKRRAPPRDSLPAAKAVKNPGLLSFAADDED